MRRRGGGSNGQGDLFGRPPPPHRDTLEEARQEVRAALEPGHRAIFCPCCGQRCHKARRKLHTGMALAMVVLYKWNLLHPGAFYDMRHGKGGESRNHNYLRFWGFVEQGDPGWWRITEAGQAFVDGALAPNAIWHFDNRCYGYSDEDTTIRRALGNRFDLDELLRSAWEPWHR